MQVAKAERILSAFKGGQMSVDSLPSLDSPAHDDDVTADEGPGTPEGTPPPSTSTSQQQRTPSQEEVRELSSFINRHLVSEYFRLRR